MPSKPKDYVPTALKLRADLAKKLDEYKEATGVTKTFVMEKALEEYLERNTPVEKAPYYGHN